MRGKGGTRRGRTVREVQQGVVCRVLNRYIYVFQVFGLEQSATELMLRGITKSTATDYARKQSTFAGFCVSLGQSPVPCNIDSMIKFVTWLYREKKLAASSIKGFVAAVRHLHLINGEIWSANQDPRFQLIMAGISKRTSPKDNRDPCYLQTWRELKVR